MRLDSDIRRDVEDELRWDPDIDATDIAVSVNKGVVTLAGFVRSYMQKSQAEVDAKRVAGVMAVANDLEVRLPNIDERPDPDTLEGEVEWNYQRERAKEAVQRVRGVKGVTSYIEIKPRVAPTEIKRKIEEALRRAAEIDASRITVESSGGEVILRGSVRHRR